MERLLFGDNQFFGVNHMSEERARAQAMRFQDARRRHRGPRRRLRRGHPHVHVHDSRADRARSATTCAPIPTATPDFAFYPCMPYAHKYANAVTESGMLGAVKRFLPDEGLLDAAIRGGSSMARKDIEGVTTLLIDAEMKMFEGLRTPVIFLQNVVVDLLLGLGFNEAFRIFADHVKERYEAEPGFITMNLPGAAAGARASTASTTRSSARTSTRSASGCAAASRHTRPRCASAGSARSPCRCSPPGRSRRRRGHRVGLRAAEHRSDRVRRLERAQHPEHPRARRRGTGASRPGLVRP